MPSCLVSMLLYDGIVDIERADRICSLTFVMNTFSWLFVHPSIFFIKYSTSAQITNGALSDF